MSTFKYAHAWARRGYRVFPITPGAKQPPLVNNWPHVASSVPKWTETNFLGKSRNIGVVTGDGFIVLDVDNKTEDGYATLEKLEAEHGVLPTTFQQTTPGGGRHYFFHVGREVPNSVGRVGPGLDIRGEAGYVLGAGSTIKGSGMYKAVGSPDSLAQCPEWLVDLALGNESKVKRVVEDRSDVDDNVALAQSRAYLRALPAAREGGRNQQLYRCAAQCKNFGVPVEDAIPLIDQEWNERNEPPLDQAELDYTIRSAYTTSTEGFGAKAASFSRIPDEGGTRPDTPKPPIEQLNELFAYCIIGSRAGILDKRHLDASGEYRYLDKEAAKGLVASMRVPVFTNGEMKYKPAFEYWYNHEDRLTYYDVVFDPSNKEYPPTTLNTWRDFPTKAQAGEHEGVKLWVDHLHENIAGGNDEYAHWVTSFFAHLIQRPWEKPLYALVLLGEKGTGKNAFVERVSNMLGTYARTDANERFLFGNFNSVSEQLLLHVLDELTWGGNKKTEGQLKSMITEHHRTIERKYSEPYTVRNYTRYVVLSNSDWAVPMSREERRYLVFEVAKHRQQQTEYFERMRRALDIEGGAPYLMYYLKTYDIDAKPISFSRPIDTGVGQEQKIRNLTGVARWWYEFVLEDGKLPGMEEWKAGHRFAARTLLDRYRRDTSDNNLTVRKFGMDLKKVRGVDSDVWREDDGMKRGIVTREYATEREAVEAYLRGVQ